MIYAEDGDDRVEGGAGSDVIGGNAGNDLLIGGPGLDVMWGGPDNDRLYAESVVDLPTAIAQGETDQPTGSKGDLLDGNAGDDIVVGGPGDDFLTGGGGVDVIIGGPGDDVILGDVTVTNAPREWGVIKQVQGSVYLWGLTSGAAEPDSNPSDDTLYGGAGDNILVGWDGAKRARRPARCPHRRTIRERIASRTRMPLDPLPPPVGYRCGHSTVRSIMC